VIVIVIVINLSNELDHQIRNPLISCRVTRIRGNTVAYLLNARTVEPEKQPLLANDSDQHSFLGNGSVRTFPR
jgi:hypothetical protein